MFYDLITIKSRKRLEIQNSGQALHNSKKKGPHFSPVYLKITTS